MGRPSKYHIPEPNNIEEFLNRNSSIYEIQKELKILTGGKLQYGYIENYVRNKYNKLWDRGNSRWVLCDQDKSADLSSKEIRDNISNILQLSMKVNSNVNSIPDSFNEMKNILNAILTKTVQLEKDINLIKSQLKDLSKDKSSEDNQLPENIIKIWNSGKSKKSISVNKELVNEVQKLFSKIYGINDNDSKVIDTALLLALLKHSK